MQNVIEKLEELFARFPGIGKRQAERFVYHLLRQKQSSVNELSAALEQLHKNVRTCTECQRFFVTEETKQCGICTDTARDQTQLLLVAKDIDLENIEHSDTYKGRYFVLGGTVPVLDKNPEDKIRITELKTHIEKLKPKEIILAFSTHPEGENTHTFIIKELKPLQKKQDFTVTTLGRGLSTGAELEYSDPDTIKNALTNRQ